MSDRKKVLALERDLLEKIDENRGDLSQAAFIEFCVDSCLGRAVDEESMLEESYTAREIETGIYATREELREFKHSIRDIIRAFLEFTVTFGLELGPGKATQDLDVIRRELHSVLRE